MAIGLFTDPLSLRGTPEHVPPQPDPVERHVGRHVGRQAGPVMASRLANSSTAYTASTGARSGDGDARICVSNGSSSLRSALSWLGLVRVGLGVRQGFRHIRSKAQRMAQRSVCGRVARHPSEAPTLLCTLDISCST